MKEPVYIPTTCFIKEGTSTEGSVSLMLPTELIEKAMTQIVSDGVTELLTGAGVTHSVVGILVQGKEIGERIIFTGVKDDV